MQNYQGSNGGSGAMPGHSFRIGLLKGVVSQPFTEYARVIHVHYSVFQEARTCINTLSCVSKLAARSKNTKLLHRSLF